MHYREDRSATTGMKKSYVDGLERLVAARQECAKTARQEYTQNLFTQPEKYRNDLRNMLGWPLAGYKAPGLPSVQTEKCWDEDGYSVYRMQFEILDGVWMSGLFFRMDGDEPMPLVMVQHGGLGTPESISGVYGDTANYNDMLARVIQHRVHAFAPQLLLWADEYGVPFDRKGP